MITGDKEVVVTITGAYHIEEVLDILSQLEEQGYHTVRGTFSVVMAESVNFKTSWDNDRG